MSSKKHPDIKDILKRLQLPATGRWDSSFYVIDLANSDDYARTYTLLCDNAQSEEYPDFEANQHNNTVKAIHYFTLDEKQQLYSIFLIANFQQDKYYVKIKEDDLNLEAADDI